MKARQFFFIATAFALFLYLTPRGWLPFGFAKAAKINERFSQDSWEENIPSAPRCTIFFSDQTYFEGVGEPYGPYLYMGVDFDDCDGHVLRAKFRATSSGYELLDVSEATFLCMAIGDDLYTELHKEKEQKCRALLKPHARFNIDGETLIFKTAGAEHEILFTRSERRTDKPSKTAN